MRGIQCGLKRAYESVKASRAVEVSRISWPSLNATRSISAVKLFCDAMYASLKDKLPPDVWDYGHDASSGLPA
jgi:hypothetical protein